ncbi:MAG: M1 family metallopeptidase [Planctomycetes bacterium]|nr:M1 family metallopeptidase [Planctomycetota bacterium]
MLHLAGRRARLLLLVLAASAPPTSAGTERGGNRLEYRIHARVDDPTKHVTGSLDVRFENRTDAATREAWFHLYLNAFSNTRSTHLVESKGSLRGTTIASEWGWQRVTSLRVGERELLGTLRFRQPDDDNADDRSVFSVDLPESVAPGQAVELHVEWESELPRVRRRTGFKDDFILAAQWFPKLGVFEGERGWNCHQFHAWTEFYSDYGTYDVVLDLPERYAGKVFGSGIVESSELRDGRALTTLAAPSRADRARVDHTGHLAVLHDFAWTADPRYEVHRETFRVGEWLARFPDEVDFARRALGKEPDTGMRDVVVNVLIHPERDEQWRRHFEATSASLFFYGLWWGGYPYEQVTVIDPAWGAGAAGGMEYPTLFTAGTQLFTTPDMHSPESVTIHECGHQFWYGLVGNNEFESAWLDEGFNTFTTSEALVRAFGKARGTTQYAEFFLDGTSYTSAPGGDAWSEAFSARTLPWLEWHPVRSSGFVDLWRDQPALTFAPQLDDPRWNDRTRFLLDPDRDALDTHAWLYADSLGYRVNAYNKPAMMLRSLPAAIATEWPGVDGWQRFLRGMRTYSERYRFEHPTPDDFFATFSEGASLDLSWYFAQVAREAGSIDWRIAVDQRREPAAAGMRVEATGEPLAFERSDDEAPWTSEIIVSRRGAYELPVLVRLAYDDGSHEDIVWSRKQQNELAWLKLQRKGARKLVSAAVDPERGYTLDVDRSNNAWYDATDPVAPARWFERAFARFASVLHWQAGIGG